MNQIDLTDIESLIKNDLIERLYRVDYLYCSSKITSREQIEWLKSLQIKLVVDLKQSHETDFSDREEFERAGIDYIHFPISSLAELSFSDLRELAEALISDSEPKLIYCMSSNRVGALLTLIFTYVLGHPKQRALEVGKKLGLDKEGLISQVNLLLDQPGSLCS